MANLESLLQLTKGQIFRKNFFRKVNKKTACEKLSIPEEELYFYSPISYEQWRALKGVSQPVDLVFYTLPCGIKAIVPLNSGTDIVAPPFELAVTPRFKRPFYPDRLDFTLDEQVAAFQLLGKLFDGFVLRYVNLEDAGYLATCHEKKLADNPVIKADVILVLKADENNLRVDKLQLKYTILQAKASDNFVPEECHFTVGYWNGKYVFSHASLKFVKPAVDAGSQSSDFVKQAQIFGRSPAALELGYHFDSLGNIKVVYGHSRAPGPMIGTSASSCCGQINYDGDFFAQQYKQGVLSEPESVKETERIFVEGVEGAQKFGQRIDCMQTMLNLANAFVNPAGVQFNNFSPVCFEK